MNTIKFIDLFAGIGGLRSGFEQAFKSLDIKTECVMTSEIKEHAIEVLKENYSHGKFVGDITKVQNEDIPDFDFLLAGFPCQAFSSAGKRLGFLDTRGTLFFEVERIIKSKQPYGFLLENVEGLVNHDKEDKTRPIGRTLETILESLRTLGYKVSWEVLDSQDFNVPQSRKRIFIIGTKDTKISLKNFPPIKAKLKDVLDHGLETIDSTFTRALLSHYSIKDILGKSIKDKRGGKNNIHSWDIELKGAVTTEQKELLNALLKARRNKKWADIIGIKWMDGMPLTLQQIETFYQHSHLESMLEDLVQKGYLKFEHPKDVLNGSNVRTPRTDLPKGYNIVAGKLSFEFSAILDPNSIAPTIVATDVNKLGVVDGEGIRQLTEKECARLFGFSDDFVFGLEKKEQIFDLLGNTVVINVAKAVSERLSNAYLGNPKDYFVDENNEVDSAPLKEYDLFTYKEYIASK